jgi:hypothetical protein
MRTWSRETQSKISASMWSAKIKAWYNLMLLPLSKEKNTLLAEKSGPLKQDSHSLPAKAMAFVNLGFLIKCSEPGLNNILTFITILLRVMGLFTQKIFEVRKNALIFFNYITIFKFIQ